ESRERATASEPGDRSEPSKRRARAPVGESEGRSPSVKTRRGTMSRHMAYVVFWIVITALAAALAGWIATDAFARGRRWIGWGILTCFFGLFALIAWLVRRRRSPLVRERLGFRGALPIYAAALCLVLLQSTSGLVIRTFGYQIARVEGQAMATTILD